MEERSVGDETSTWVGRALAKHPPARRRFLVAFSAVTVVIFVAHVAHSGLGYGSGGANGVASDGLYDAVIFGAGVICLARAILVPADRPAWLLLSAGMISWATGEVYSSVASPGHDILAPPSPADAFYLAFYPATYAGLVLLVRKHLRRFPPSLWLDGVIEGLAVAAVGSALIAAPLLHDAGRAGQLGTDIAYPLADLLLLSLVVTAFALRRWRAGTAFTLLGAAMATAAVADGWYVYAQATRSYVDGQPLDSLWLVAALLVAWAAWQPEPQRAPAGRTDRRGPRSDLAPPGEPDHGDWLFAVPVVSALAVVGVLVADHFSRLHDLPIALAVATLVVVLARMALTLWEHHRLLTSTRTEAFTDALTGLGNRRRLLVDLERQLDEGQPAQCVLALFDLDGFKDYNDAFGHQLGDALLARLGQLLATAVEGSGEPYRLGGDEFCVILQCPPVAGSGQTLTPADVRARVTPSVVALTSAGGDFAVGCSYGAVALPEEGETATGALETADHRMYAHKAGRHDGQFEHRRGRLGPVVPQAGPETPLAEGLGSVTELAVAVGRRLGMSDQDVDAVASAAALREVGRGAIPDDLIAQPSRLDPDQRAFIRLHPIAGERVLAAVPTLHSAARLVRSSHERFDGAGYPDGLGGEGIPLGSRIIAACHSLGSLVLPRAYRPAVSLGVAMDDLTAGMGARFDPVVVEAVTEEISVTLESADQSRPITT